MATNVTAILQKTHLHVGDGAHHALPEGQQVVDTVGCKLPHVEGFHSKLGDELDGIRVVLHCHQFTQLIIALQSQQQPAEFMVVCRITQALKQA